MSIPNTLTMLNKLIQISEDGKTGFARAGEQSTASELKTSFESRASECGLAATELQGLVTSLGGLPKHRGTMAGAAYRGCAKMKSTVGDINIAMLDEMERAEDVAKATYAETLSYKLSKQVHDVVQRQFDGVVRHHKELRNLRNRYTIEKEPMAE